MNKPNDNKRTWEEKTANIRAFGKALSEASSKPAIDTTQPAERTQGYKPGYLRHTRAVLQQTTADLQTAVDYIGKLEQERDEARAQVADLLAVVLKTREYMAVNSPANGWANSLRLDINATIAAAEGRQS